MSLRSVLFAVCACVFGCAPPTSEDMPQAFLSEEYSEGFPTPGEGLSFKNSVRFQNLGDEPVLLEQVQDGIGSWDVETNINFYPNQTDTYNLEAYWEWPTNPQNSHLTLLITHGDLQLAVWTITVH